jgi:hypothetical protein
MTRILGRLSVQSVRQRGYYGDGGGLYLRVAPGGAKGWIFRYGGRGRRRDMGLGVYPASASPKRANSPATAAACLPPASTPLRRATRNARRLPSSRKGDDVRRLCNRIHQRPRSGWRNPKHRQQWKNTLATYVSPVVGLDQEA